MPVPVFHDAIHLIRSSASPRPFPDPPRPASAELIRAAETRLGVTFPESYREFLSWFGTLSFGSDEFLGLITPNFETNRHPCVVFSTLLMRRTGGLDPRFVNVYNVGEGTHMVLDTSRMRDGECPVIAWRHSSVPTEEVASNFAEFLLERAEVQIERKRAEAGGEGDDQEEDDDDED